MSLPAMHPTKRRRLDQSTSTLTKPFRSPMRVDVKKQPSAQEHNNQSKQVQDAHDTTASSPIHKTSSICPSSSQSSPVKPTVSGTKPSHLSSQRTTQPKSSAYLTLQKQHTRLLNDLAALRKSLDTTNQALSLESSDQDAELEILIIKWRGIAREAAEELFSVAKDKVNRMGGVGAWRERTQKKDQAWGGDGKQGFGWGGDEEIDEENLTEEQKEDLKVLREEAEREHERYAEVDTKEAKEPKKEEKDDESFTMDMMLRQLNVGMDIIGYEVESQRWSD